MSTKKQDYLNKLFFLLPLLLTSFIGLAQNQIYSYNFTSKQWDSQGTRVLNGIDWYLSGNMRNTSVHYGYEASRGQQLGSSNNSFSQLSLSTSDITGTITKVKVWSARSGNASVSLNISVGNNTSSDFSLTGSNTVYEYVPQNNASGTINLNWITATPAALYIKKIEIEYTTSPTFNIQADRTTNEVLDYAFGAGPSQVTEMKVSSNRPGQLLIENSGNNFEISESRNGTFSRSFLLSTFNGEEKTIYVRLKSGLNIGNYNATLTVSSPGNGNLYVPLNFTGKVTPVTPSISNQTFCGEKTVADLPNYNGSLLWYLNNNDTNPLSPTTPLQNGRVYYVSQVINGIESLGKDNVLVTLTPIPSAPSQRSFTVCESTRIQDLNTDYFWFENEYTNTVLSPSTLLTSRTYYAVRRDSNCESNRVAIVITASQTPHEPEFSSLAFCGYTLASSLPSGYNWYHSNTNTDVVENSDVLQSGIYYASTQIGNCESTLKQITVTIAENPAAPVIAPITNCGGITIAEITLPNYKWYTSATSLTALQNSFSITETSTFFVGAFNGNCESERTQVVVTIQTIPTNPTIAPIQFCGVKTVADLSTDYKWYRNTNDTTPLAATSPLNSGTYYATSFNEFCESQKVAVSITIIDIPATPVIAPVANCGAITIAEITQPNYNWYTSATSLTALQNSFSITETSTFFVGAFNGNCESERTQVVVTIQTIPTNPTIAPIQFCGVKTVADLSTDYKWYRNTNDTTPLAATSPLNSGTYYATSFNEFCESQKVAVSITVTEIPATPVIAPIANCGAITIAEITLPNYKWYTSATSLTALQNSFSITETSTLFVAAFNGNCESERTQVVVTIQTIPTNPTIAPIQFCGVKTVADLSTDYKWYRNMNDTTPLAATSPLNSGTYYATSFNEFCESQKVAVSITVTEIPATPVIAPIANCGAITIAEITLPNYKWYTSATSLTALQNSFSITETSTLFVAAFNGNCESERTQVVVTIHTIPTNPTIAHIQFCGVKTVADLSTDYKWYRNTNDTTPLAATTSLNSGTYYATNFNEFCESQKIAVLITVNTTQTPTVNPTYRFCIQDNATFENLNIQGEQLKYYASVSSTTPLPVNTVLENNKEYFITQTINDCESSRVRIFITLQTTLAPTAQTNQTYCEGNTLSDIVINGLNIKWYNSANATEPLNDNTLLRNTTYYASQTLNGCESIERIAVQINVISLPIITTRSVTVCDNTTLNDLILDNYSFGNLSWYASLNATTRLNSNYQINRNTTLYAVANNGNCSGERMAISIYTNPAVTPPDANNQTICGNGTIADLVVFTAENAIVEWFNSANGTTALSSNTNLTTGTYYVSQKIGSCTSTRRSIFVTVLSKVAPAINNFSVCNGTVISDITWPITAGAHYEWYSSPTSTTPLAANTVIYNGTYYIARNHMGCISNRKQVTVTVNEVPNAPTGQIVQYLSIPSTISSIEMNEQNIKWYESYENAVNNVFVLTSSTVLQDNKTYYGVLENLNGCRSNPTAVTIHLFLSNNELDSSELSVYPNPTTDFVNIQYNTVINKVEVYDLSGKHILENTVNQNEVLIDLSNFSNGTYILNIYSNDRKSSIKVLKK